MEIDNIYNIRTLISELKRMSIDELKRSNNELYNLAISCGRKYPQISNPSDLITDYLDGWSKLTKIYLDSAEMQLKHLESRPPEPKYPDKIDALTIKWGISLSIDYPIESVSITIDTFKNEFKGSVDSFQEAYFSNDQIEKMKKKLCDRIMNSDDVFRPWVFEHHESKAHKNKIWR